jgi:hypothetical protein
MLRSIVHRLSLIVSGRLSIPQLAFVSELQAACAACDTHCTTNCIVAGIRRGDGGGRIGPSSRSRSGAETAGAESLAPVAALEERLTEETLATWPATAHSLLFAELEHYRRLRILAARAGSTAHEYCKAAGTPLKSC